MEDPGRHGAPTPLGPQVKAGIAIASRANCVGLGVLAAKVAILQVYDVYRFNNRFRAAKRFPGSVCEETFGPYIRQRKCARFLSRFFYIAIDPFRCAHLSSLDPMP